MIKIGEAPYLECSSRGEVRLSAFYARIRSRNNNSIEEIYQAAKIFEDGSTGLTWREGKGKKAINMDEVAKLYSKLWDEYIEENPYLLGMIKAASGLSDMFGQENHQCQAVELWRIKQHNTTKHCVEAAGYCSHRPDTCLTDTKGFDCPYFSKG
jgi:hypothetical protein